MWIATAVKVVATKYPSFAVLNWGQQQLLSWCEGSRPTSILKITEALSPLILAARDWTTPLNQIASCCNLGSSPGDVTFKPTSEQRGRRLQIRLFITLVLLKAKFRCTSFGWDQNTELKVTGKGFHHFQSQFLIVAEWVTLQTNQPGASTLQVGCVALGISAIDRQLFNHCWWFKLSVY